MILSTLRRTFTKYPVLGSIATYTTMIGAADATCQFIERKKKFDWTRFKNMATLGIIYYGPVFHYYYRYLDHKLPGTNPRTILVKMFIDQVIVTLPSVGMFYILIGALEKKSWRETKEEMRVKYLPTYATSCLFWPTAQFINFIFVPAFLRVAYVSAGSFVWLTFLSYIKNSPQLPAVFQKIEDLTTWKS